MNSLNDLGWLQYPVLGLGVILSLAVWLTLAIGSLYLLYFLLTLPMRRNERVRLFLDLLEVGLKDGQSPEHAIATVSRSRDPLLGTRFQMLAAMVEQGQTLGQALEKVQQLLPPQVVAMIRVGERLGDVGKVLPACRQLLADGISQVRGALNYILVLAFVITPMAILIPVVIQYRVIPSYRMVFAGLSEGLPLPAFTRMVFATGSLFTLALTFVLVFLWVLVLGYTGGPRLRGWLRGAAPSLVDRFVYVLPWRRCRMQRDFGCMLALLLDAGVSESEAVGLAGEAVDNRVMRARSLAVVKQLSEGVKLNVAIGAIDRSRELQWRLTNALRRGAGFLRALDGWHESLAARAFQQEQTAAQLLTTVLVLFNGFVVASIVIAIFLALIAVLQIAALW